MKGFFQALAIPLFVFASLIIVFLLTGIFLLPIRGKPLVRVDFLCDSTRWIG